MKNENDNTIVLHDEEGQEWKFEVIDIITVNNKDYALLMPMNELEEDENGDQILVDLDDEEELAMVEEAWEEMVYDEEDENEE